LDLPPGPATVTLDQCLRSTSTGSISVQQLANAIRVNRKTVGVWLRAAGLPAPERLISWCRVYWVAHVLGDNDLTVADVARALHFSSESDLRRMVARYAHCTPTRLRDNGADIVLAALSRVRESSDRQISHRSTAIPQ